MHDKNLSENMSDFASFSCAAFGEVKDNKKHKKTQSAKSAATAAAQRKRVMASQHKAKKMSSQDAINTCKLQHTTPQQ